MAYGATLTDKGVFGDLRYEIYTLTDVADDSSSTITTGMKKPKIGFPTIEKAGTDQIQVVSISGQTVTLDATTANDDGKIMILGK